MNTIESKFDLREAEFVAMGNDSSVYRLDHFVAKKYEYIDAETLNSYRELTNTMARSLHQNPLVANGILFGEEWQAAFSVVPILEIEMVDKVRSYSSYISGPNLLQLLNVVALQKQLDIPEPEQRDFLRKITNNSDTINQFVKLTAPNALASRTMKETGIYPHVAAVNTKYKVRPDEKTVEVIITDLSADIASIEFPYKVMGRV